MGTFRTGKRSVAPGTTPGLRSKMIWDVIKGMVEFLYRYGLYVWDHNPLRVLSRRHRRLYFVQNYGELMIKPSLGERVLDLFLTDNRRRQRLLKWVHDRIGSHILVYDFFTCWQDGIALCALLESICPGVCPSYHLLPGHNRVKNCRLGLKLANKYLYVPMDLISAEEMAIANKSTEHKIIQYISMVKWACQNIKEKWSTLHESLIAAKTGRCFTKGSGLRSGIVDKRSKFTVLVSDTIGVFNLLIEVRGPNHEYCGERIVSLHQAKALLDKSFDFDVPQSDNIKYLEDIAGNTFVRKKIPSRYPSGSSDPIFFDIQCGEEGTFYVTFVPRRAGLHAVAVKWQNHHVENSPFTIKVYKASNISTKNMKGAHEKRVIYDSLSFSSHSTDNLETHELLVPGTCESNPVKDASDSRSLNATTKAKAYSKGRQLTVTRRRVLRRIITRNGEDIIIEESLSPSLSQQSSFTDNSDDDSRCHRLDKDDHKIQPNATVATPVGKVLGTVLEERQGSKDSEHSNSIDQSYPYQTVKYKFTEIQEHNRFDDEKPSNRNDKPLQSATDHSQDHKMTLFEQHAHNASIKGTARTTLKRLNSIHHPYKQSARRTTSDGTIFRLRQQLVSKGTFDTSDTNSEVSSDDKHLDDDIGEEKSVLKLLNSNSLKKSCFYMSGNAVEKTISVSVDGQSLLGDLPESLFPEKAKLCATQSLPIMRTYWQRDLDTEGSVQETHSNDIRLSTVRFNDAYSSSLDAGQHVENNHGTSTTNEALKQDKSENTEKPSSSNSNENRTIEVVMKLEDPYKTDSNVFKFDNEHISAITSPNNMLPCKTKPTEKNADSETNTVTEIPSNKIPETPTARGNLTRQTNICCKGSSTDSASTKTDPSSEEKTNTDQSNSSKTRKCRTFKSISVHSITQPKSCQDSIDIISPLAKIDKSTQVTNSEITKETGCDLIEGVYLLLRKLSFKVPSQISLNTTYDFSLSSKPEPESKCFDIKPEVNSLNLLQVPKSPHDTVECFPRVSAECPKSYRADQSIKTNEATNTHCNVNAWFERNNVMNSPCRLVPGRQFTLETVDSGFDDNQCPTSYNRQGRRSLPNILSDNGHVRLHRRPYRGRFFALDPRLVNSNSSQSISLEQRETGNEADDESPLHPTYLLNRQQQRRRHRRINRDESFSMSDSELQERQKRIRRRLFCVERSQSRQDGHNTTVSNKEEVCLGNNPQNLSLVQENLKSLSDFEDQHPTTGGDSEPSASVITGSDKLQRERLSTATSDDSNYHGFGVSKSYRSDFLSQIDSFKRLCPTSESLEETKPSGTISQCADEESAAQLTDGTMYGQKVSKKFEVSEDFKPLEANTTCSSDMTSKKAVDTNTVFKDDKESDDAFHLEDDIFNFGKASFENCDDMAFSNDELDEELITYQRNRKRRSSTTYFDIFSSFDHSYLNGNIDPSSVAMLGDVISLETSPDVQTIFRLAGAGLRYGTVGANNSFQVWVENENPSEECLTVSVLGPLPHSVTETSVIYTGDNLYEISYAVVHPGIYRIYVRWGDQTISETPYICDVNM